MKNTWLEKWEAVEAFFLSPQARQMGALHFWRERLFAATCLLSIIVGTVALFPSLALSIKEDLWPVFILDLTAYVTLITVLVVKRIPFQIRVWTVCLGLYLLGAGLSVMLGLLGAAYIWLFAFGIVAAMLLGVKAGLIALGLNALTLALVAVLIRLGLLPWADLLENALEKWVVLGINFLLVNLMTTISTALILNGLEKTIELEQESSRSLEKEMAEHIETEHALRLSEAKFRALSENAPDVVLTLDRTGLISHLNPAWSKTLGYTVEDSIGRPLTDFVHADNRPALEAVLDRVLNRGETVQDFQAVLDHRTGSRLVLLTSLAPNKDHAGRIVGIVGGMKDLTSYRLLENQLHQSRKMEALGTLAGGVAHDFNNLLAVINGYSELGLEAAGQGGKEEESFNRILDASDRAKNLVQQILSFSRKAEFKLQPLDLNDELNKLVPLLERTIPKMISLQLSLAAKPLVINANANQVEQIVLNLAVNAADAMPDGGRLVIETAEQILNQARGSTPPGDYVRLTVADSGSGMSPETIEHIFDPFFTTKEVGKGTGLGLATVFGIVKSHQGFIHCTSQMGRGAAFDLLFPALEEIRPPEPPSRNVSVETAGRGETILIVDDEPELLELGRQMLARLGYRPVIAASGEEALRVYSTLPQRPDLVVLDINMPGMGGRKCLQELLKADRQARVVIASGYFADGRRNDAVLEEAVDFITKPFMVADLAATVRKALDAPRP